MENLNMLFSAQSPIQGKLFLFQLFNIVIIILWIWLIVDCARRTFKKNLEKGIWLAAMIFAPGIASVAYLIAIRIYHPQGIMEKDGNV